LHSDISVPRKKGKWSKPTATPVEDIHPVIPIPDMQRTGQELQIPAEELTVEKLMAAPSTASKNVPNDKQA
jgi:hypothetical protein